MKISQVTYGLMAILTFIGLKLAFKFSTTEDLDLLLYPTNFLFSILYNAEWQYDSVSGYYYPELNILINKSCSGGNFLLICFLTFVLYTFQRVVSNRMAIGSLLLTLLASYVIAIFSNVSRILTLLQFNRYNIGKNGWSHEAIGAFVYLIILLITFLSIKFLIEDKRQKKLTSF